MSVDKLVDSTQLNSDLTSVANAIRTKGGTSSQLAFPAGFVSAIDAIPTGGGGDEDTPLKDVVFIDYDGSIVQQYTKAEFLALDALPANPSHSGLTAQGWNWTLAGAKTYVTNNGCLVIGQNYTTSDGKTRIYLEITDREVGCELSLRFYTTVKGGVTVDWGDGTSTTSTANAGAANNLKHTYSTVGSYIITYTATSGSYSLGYNGSGGTILEGRFVVDAVKKIEIGNNVTEACRQCFQNLQSLESISIPTTLLSFGNGTNGNMFADDLYLKCVVFPSGYTLNGVTHFNNCVYLKFISLPNNSITFSQSIWGNNLYSLRMLTMPEMANLSSQVAFGCKHLEKYACPGTYTTLAGNVCRDLINLRKFTIPASVTTIADYAMTNTALFELHMLPTSPPTIANTRGLPDATYITIYVPYSDDHSILNNYKAATGWASYASKIQEETP